MHSETHIHHFIYQGEYSENNEKVQQSLHEYHFMLMK